MTIPPGYEAAYPRGLWERERKILDARRKGGSIATAERPPVEVVGVALSGGGIRSATFCLGVLQGLAKFDLASKIDYLATVSGGGYVGAFFCRLFGWQDAKPGTTSVDEVLGRVPDSPPVKWLRENGRYLAPRGSGDLLLLGATLVRNWIAIQVVLITFLVTLLVVPQVLRASFEICGSQYWQDYVQLLQKLPGFYSGWWSPYVGLAVIPLVLGVLPCGWAYWMIGRVKYGLYQFLQQPALGLQVAVMLTLYLWSTHDPVWRIVAEVLLPVEALTIVWWAVALDRVWLAVVLVSLLVIGLLSHHSEVVLGVEYSVVIWMLAYTPRGEDWIVKCDDARHALTDWFKTALVCLGLVLGFAIVDATGQWLYVAILRPAVIQMPSTWLGAAFGVLVTVAGFAQKIAVTFGGRVGGLRPGKVLSIAATAGALVVLAVVLVSTDALSHAIAWKFAAPPTVDYASQNPDALSWLLPALVLAGVGSFLFGWSWPFLNRSSQLPLYSARLTRAYLGACNTARNDPKGQSVARVVAGDNMGLPEYYGLLASAKAPPLHLINVTINETIDGKSQLEQRDHKGIGMAIGPCSFSAGVRHHAVFATHGSLDPILVYPTGVPSPFQMFQGWNGGEVLPLGQWIGISGAAFSTGLGARTNLGLSLLCGFGNVRLGYWWDSEVDPGTRPQRASLGLIQRFRAFFTRWLFPVQSYLINEFLARFPGPARRRWYLSDGGHFENLGGYELIRRRLRRIVLVDAEADPEYTFEGLANLIRKARLDFGAEIRFLTESALKDKLDPTVHRYFGTLEQLRRGNWSQEPVTDPGTGELRVSVNQADSGRYSLRHAALAKVVYADEPESSQDNWLVYLKPTLTGDEPEDIIQYHAGHPSFPQESTADQFFDEAQWESYRRLGLEISTNLFGLQAAGGGQTPRSLVFGP